MSKSDDNTNELESYGVWVKNSTGGSDNPETPADTSDELNLDDVGLDLPDFDDSDFSDMFKDEPQGADSNALDDFGSEDDTTLSTDELANITDGFEVEQVDAPADTESDDLDLGDFDIPSSEPDASTEISDDFSFDTDFSEITDDASTSEETAVSDEEVSEEPVFEDSITEDDFAIEESSEPSIEESSEPAIEETSEPSIEE